MHPLVGGRMFRDADSRPPLPCRADRPRRKDAAAVWADVEDFRLHAIGAEGAFVGADARVERVGRQILVAIFAVRSKLQRHGVRFGCKGTIADRSFDSNGEIPSICAMHLRFSKAVLYFP